MAFAISTRRRSSGFRSGPRTASQLSRRPLETLYPRMNLMSEANQHPPQQPPSRTVQVSADPQQRAAQAKDLHLYAVGGMIIGGITDGKGLLKAPNRTAASVLAEAFLTELIRSVRPRDGVEEML